MLARDERERLLAAVVELYAEGRDGEPGGEWASEVRSLPPAPFAGMLNEEEESLVAAVNEALARIVDAVSDSHPQAPPPPPSTIVGALGGAELVMRGEILAGQAERLPRLLPGFAYLVTLPFLGQEEALRLSRQARRLALGAERE